jgi:hypothetical protein
MIRLPQTETEYLNAIVDAAKMGATAALAEAGITKPFLKLCEAHRLYGRSVVDRWIKEGLVKPLKDGNRNAGVRIDRIKIEAVARTYNRATYLTTEERKL